MKTVPTIIIKDTTVENIMNNLQGGTFTDTHDGNPSNQTYPQQLDLFLAASSPRMGADSASPPPPEVDPYLALESRANALPLERRSEADMPSGVAGSKMSPLDNAAAPTTELLHYEASRYDVRIGGGRGLWKSGHSKGGCVNFILKISSTCGQGGEGGQNPKILRMS